MNYQKINFMHVFLIGPLLYYIGLTGKTTDPIYYGMLMALSALIPFVVRTPTLKQNYRNGINWVHYLLWTSLFLWISCQRNKLSDDTFKAIKYLGIVTISIHAYIIYTYK